MFRAAILTAKEVELNAVRQHLSGETRVDSTFDGTVYRRAKIRTGLTEENSIPQWDIAVYRTGRGQQQAAYGTQILLQHFKPDVILYVGVAGGDPTDGELSVGDVVVAKVVRYYERTSQYSDTFVIKDESHFPNRALIGAAEYEADESEWLTRVAGAKPNSKVVVGEIASGEKVQKSGSSALWTAIRAKYPDVVAVETEGQGFHYSLAQSAGRGIMIRAISDLLDNKDDDDGEEGSDDQRQQLASNHAAAFAITLLANLNTTFLAEAQEAKFDFSIILKIKANDIAGVYRATELLADAINDPHLSVESLQPANSFILRVSTTLFSAAYANAAFKGGFLSKLIGVKVETLQADSERTGNKTFDLFLEAVAEADTQSILKLRGAVSEHFPSWKAATLLLDRLANGAPDEPQAVTETKQATRPKRISKRARTLREMRERQGLSQEELAAASGLARSTISRMESGRSPGTEQAWARVEGYLKRRRDAVEFSNYLRGQRTKLGISMRELSRITGISERTLTHIEARRITPKLEIMNKIAAALNVSGSPSGGGLAPSRR